MSETTPNRQLLGSLVAVLALIVFVAWFFSRKLQEVDRGLLALSTQLESLAGKQESLATDLGRALDQTDQARQQAHAADERANQSEQARAQALKDAEQAQSAKAVAERQAQGAREEAVTARQELEQIRKAREEELNRMQEALSKVATTRRTADGMVVDLTGSSFRFEFDKATLGQENRELLSRLAGILLASHGYGLYVYGHTDDIGTEEYNRGLSERRAKAVRDYLEEAGIPPEIVTHKGFGKSSPRVKATTPEAREKNRRVEIGIVDTVIKYAGEARRAK
ncbi:MAG: OmpA family protein [Bryobacteraceae bacterium]